MPLCWRSIHAFVLATFRNEVKTNMIVTTPLCWDANGATHLCWDKAVATHLCWNAIALHAFMLEHFRNEANEHQCRHAFVLRQSRCHAFVLERSRRHPFVLGRNITINESML